jgi:hypothetical protein
MREWHNCLASVSEPSFKRNCTCNPTQLYTQGDTSFVYVAHVEERARKNEYTYLYALPCMYTMKCSTTSPARAYTFLTKLSIYGNSCVRFQVGDSASTKVCHQPHDTFNGWYVSTGTLQGTFLSIESPRPSCKCKFKFQKHGSKPYFSGMKGGVGQLPGHICSIPSRIPRLHLQMFSNLCQMPCQMPEAQKTFFPT